MADTSDSIPANGIRFNKAFELLFNAICPDAAELNATLNRLDQTALDRAITPEADEPEHQEFWARWEAAHKEVEPILLDALRSGELTAYQFNPRTEKDRDIPVKYWEADLILSGDVLEHPPIYFFKADFDAWLKKVLGENKRRGRPPIKRDIAERACKELWGGPPPKDMGTAEARDKVIQWCSDKEISEWPMDDTILRALGRKK
jgi:hypothetical protein